VADDDFHSAGGAAPPPPPRKDDGFSIEDAGDDPPPPPPGKGGRGRPPRRRDELLSLLADVDEWRSPDGVAHVAVPMGDYRAHMRADSTAFKGWLAVHYSRRTGRGLSGTATAEVVNLATARALDSGDVRRPCRRWGLDDDGGIWLDLGGGDPRGERRAVHITAAGSKLVAAADVSIPFLRAPDALPLPVPEPAAASSGDLGRVFNTGSQEDLALAWAWLVNAARPFAEGGAYPLLLLHGEQGSGKSGATRALQNLIDPSTLTGRAVPREERDIFITAGNRHVLAFDNLSHLSDSFADCFCRFATGGGYSARSLHTDADESIFTAVKPLLFNGIPSTLLARPDLADRALTIELRPPAVRREDAALRREFLELWPGLLGLLCDGLSSALRNLSTTRIENPPRMADAAIWAEAAAPGLGIPPGMITDAWRANRHQADRAALEVDDMAQAVVALLDEMREREARDDWKGSPSELFGKLIALVPERVSRSPLWPRNAAGMGTKLRRLAPMLRAVHRIDVLAGKGGSDSGRYWSLRRVP
jgi:putative DNA primase/helicase